MRKMKWFFLLAALLCVLTLTGCGKNADTAVTAPEATPTAETAAKPGAGYVSDTDTAPDVPVSAGAESGSAPDAADIDLTAMSGTMIYSYVYSVVSDPAEFVGRRFRISGAYDESYWDETGTTYHYIVIADATACCAQGLEFVLTDGSQSFPNPGDAIEICGVFEPYDELGTTYYHIVADTMV